MTTALRSANLTRRAATLVAPLVLGCFSLLSACTTRVVVRERGPRVVYVAQPAPPAPVAEEHGPPGAPDAFWVGGHWQWTGNTYAWHAGHWDRRRPGEAWVGPRWANENGRWVFHGGHWKPEVVMVSAPPPVIVEEVVVREAPPAPRVEVIPAPPSAEHVWVGGHWKWEGNRYAWIGGHYETRRVGHVWEAARWQQTPGGYKFVPGHWRTM